MSRPRFHTLRVHQIRRETSECISVSFDVPEELKDAYLFRQGQYLTLRAVVNGEDIRRSYSICTGINDGDLRVAIKRVEQGIFSNWAFDSLSEGDEIQVMTPTGHFTAPLDPAQKKNYLLVAAGSGITPVLSIVKSVLSAEPKSGVSLIYGNRFFSSIIFREELEDLKDRHLGRFRLFHVLSAEPNEIDLFHGRINSEKLDRFCTSFINFDKTDEVFVCGPEPLIRCVKDFAFKNGKDESQVHFELFATPGTTPVSARPYTQEKKDTIGKVCDVNIILDGQRVNFKMPMDGISILDAAQLQGMDVPFSCKGGMCCTCRAHLDEGQVEMEVNYALEPGELDAGFILTCQSRPVTEKVVVDYDKQ
ncbi:MAG: phenylacetate-CoA oxygenase/reductase subunit PaaK [Crocinitomicaceae bacterium]|nr:phenylacetate-CoA oxygenase/reductase subunit PaaK [Crocinitomicaceae bacterium]